MRRRLRSLIDLALIGALGVASSVAAQPEAQDTARAQGVATLEAFLADVHSLRADFHQEVWSGDQLQQTDTGTLAIERPNRFRWNYLEPTELTIVGDGVQLWIYDVELETVTRAPFDDTVGASPAMLLSGDRSVRDAFEVVQMQVLEGLSWVKLEPKAAGSDFASVLIGFDGSVPRRLEVVDGLNQVTRIELDHLEVNPDLADTVFKFEVPPGVDVIGEEG